MALLSKKMPFLHPFLRRKVAPVALCIAGFIYPLLGFAVFAVFRFRHMEKAWQIAPLFGAILSLLLYSIDFIVLVVA